MTVAGDTKASAEVNITQDMASNTHMIGHHCWTKNNGVHSIITISANITVADWLKNAWTLKLRGNVANAANTLHWKWIVTRIKGES